jgi:hypothetical protein
MKLLFILIGISFLTSCKKEVITPTVVSNINPTRSLWVKTNYGNIKDIFINDSNINIADTNMYCITSKISDTIYIVSEPNTTINLYNEFGSLSYSNKNNDTTNNTLFYIVK